MARAKVFVLGFHKTGTTSIQSALRMLGYTVGAVRSLKELDVSPDSWETLKALMEESDAFRGQPWPLFFREIYECRPDSKFILTIRPTKDWLSSAQHFFGKKETPKREAIYGAGSPLGNEDAYAERYEKHNNDVLGFFADKPGSLLVMDLGAGAGWPELCKFLGADTIPATDFPHRNPTIKGKYEVPDRWTGPAGEKPVENKGRKRRQRARKAHRAAGQ